MRNILIMILSIGLVACEEEAEPDDNPCIDWQIQVSVSQNVRLLDNNMQWIEEIDFDMLRLFPTDQNWNFLLANDGLPIKEFPNGIEAQKVYDEHGNIKQLNLFLGQIGQQKEIDEKKCYFLLRINEDTYHQINSEYYTDCGDFILTKFSYNGKEYTANDWETIDIIVD